MRLFLHGFLISVLCHLLIIYVPLAKASLLPKSANLSEDEKMQRLQTVEAHLQCAQKKKKTAKLLQTAGEVEQRACHKN